MEGKDNEKLCDELGDLIKLDYDAIEAYEAAIRHADDETLRTRLTEFMQDHRRHTQNLGEQVRLLGGTPPDGAGMMRMLTEGSVLLGAVMEDRGVLKAMSKNEAVTNRAYEKALDKLGSHPAAAVVQQNRDDERRHKAWIDQKLEALGGDPVDPGAIQAGRQTGASGQVGDRR